MDSIVDLLRVKADLTLKNIHHGIAESEVLNVLEKELPEIKPLSENISNPENVYKVMQVFANYTKQLAVTGNLKEVKHCFNVAEKLINEGNNIVKNGIFNCYLFSVSTVMDLTSPVSQTIKNLLTDSLRKEYYRQTGASCI